MNRTQIYPNPKLKNDKERFVTLIKEKRADGTLRAICSTTLTVYWEQNVDPYAGWVRRTDQNWCGD